MKEEGEKVSEIERANQTLNELVAKLADARQRQSEAEAEAAVQAFPALTSGDAASLEALEGLNLQIAKSTREIVSLSVAIKEAEPRVDAAAADVAERERAQAALALLSDFEARGEALDKALAKFVAEYVELIKDFRGLDRLGFAPTTHALVAINMKSAAATKLMFTDLQTDFLALYARRDFRTVIEGWAGAVRGRATARLNKSAKAA